MHAPDRSDFDFARKARDFFGFLEDAGFTEVEALPTLVRYRKGNVEVDIYHGRQSYEIGGGVAFSGTRYSMAEIIRASDPDAAKEYRNPVAASPERVAPALEELASLMQRYGVSVLRGDGQLFAALEGQRKHWAEEFSLDVLAAQLRPLAEDAFRRGDYARAAELYGRIRGCLSPAEAKKLSVAQARRRG